RETCEDQRNVFDAAGLRLTLDLPNTPVCVQGDSTRLAQVLVNLLNNAAKFTDAGGQVTVRLAADSPWAVITVRDSGVGIEPEMLPHLFDSFVQAEGSLERSRGGLGLGLALVKGLVELHEGQVGIASRGPGQGTAVTVRLPLSAGAPK